MNKKNTAQLTYYLVRLLWQFRSYYFEIAIASLFINIFSLSIPIYIRIVYDRIIPNQTIDSLWTISFGLLIILCFDIILKIIRLYISHVICKQTDLNLSNAIFDHILNLPFKQSPSSSGHLMKLVNEVDMISAIYSSSTIIWLLDIPFIGLFLLVIYFIGGSIVWVPLIFLISVIVLITALSFSLYLTVVNGDYAISEKNHVLSETIQGLESIKIQGAYQLFQQKWYQAIKRVIDLRNRFQVLSGYSGQLIVFMQQISYVGIIIMGVYLIMLHHLTMGGLIAISILSGRAQQPIVQSLGIIIRLQHAIVSLKKLNQHMKDQSKPAHEGLIPNDLTGHIRFENVSFTYSEKLPAILSNMSFTIQAGERVGIIGKIGSGKSTLLKLLMKCYLPQSGIIRMDQIPLNQIEAQWLRQYIGYVPQDFTLFSGTVFDNIRMSAPDIDDKKIIEVMTMFKTCSETFKENDMLVERGSNLSGGFRQVINIARCLVKESSIVLMDEPTSLMDSTTENEFIRQMQHKIANKTFLLVTHRFSLLTLVDRLIVMDKGQILLDGAKEDVLKALQKGQVHKMKGI